tara:strand:+ start:857 stop:1135 length:279 start_codon:yes stop_codon:yes gene_type:complete
MAKTKKVVDLKPTKVTDEQLKRIQDTVSSINKGQMEIGKLETNKHALIHQISGYQEALQLLQNELEKEYGTVDININDGTINYSKENGEANS